MEGDNIFRYRNMDIKLEGREMATVVYSNEEDDMCSLVIDGEAYVEDEERAIIPKAVLKQIRVEDIPENFQITIKILLPLFRKLGFVNVKYNHGNKEFGNERLGRISLTYFFSGGNIILKTGNLSVCQAWK